MKDFWFAKKKTVAAMIAYGILFFLVLYEYPMLGWFDSPTLTAGIPTFVLYIWVLNVLYIVLTAAVVMWMFRNADRIQWKGAPKEG
ncbi:MAG: hypothetical protein HXS41_11030 [Theionarchaea archaeon]|nr:hypothetical protein [Theionarchaea archaeon]